MHGIWCLVLKTDTSVFYMCVYLAIVLRIFATCMILNKIMINRGLTLPLSIQ